VGVQRRPPFSGFAQTIDPFTVECFFPLRLIELLFLLLPPIVEGLIFDPGALRFSLYSSLFTFFYSLNS